MGDSSYQTAPIGNQQATNDSSNTYRNMSSVHFNSNRSSDIVTGSNVQRKSSKSTAAALSQVTRGKVISIEPIMENFIQKTMMKVQLSTGNQEERTVIDSGVEAIRIDPNIVTGDTVSLISTGPHSFTWKRVDTTLVDETTTTSNRKKRKVFRVEDLMDKNGIPLILNTMPNVHWKGPGHEGQDIRQMIQIYREWLYHVNPKANFTVLVKRMETFGSTKKLHQFMDYYREGLDPLADDFVDVLLAGAPVNNDSRSHDNDIIHSTSGDLQSSHIHHQGHENELFDDSIMHQPDISPNDQSHTHTFNQSHSTEEDERALLENEFVDDDFSIEGYNPSYDEPTIAQEPVMPVNSSITSSNPWLKRQKVGSSPAVAVALHSLPPEVSEAPEANDTTFEISHSSVEGSQEIQTIPFDENHELSTVVHDHDVTSPDVLLLEPAIALETDQTAEAVSHDEESAPAAVDTAVESDSI